MKKTTYSIIKHYKKGMAAVLAASMVLTGIQVPAFANNSEETDKESSADVSGGLLTRKSITLDLTSDDLRDAALAAIHDNQLFDAQDYLGATSDSTKAIKEYEAFFNENPGLYVVDVPDSVEETLSTESDTELRVFVQKDTKMRKTDLAETPSEISREDETTSKDVEFRYGTEKDIILYEPSTDVDTLINGGEDAYYKEPVQDTADNSDYELTGKEKITFMFINGSDDAVKFTLKVDDVTYDKVTVSGRKAALKKVLADAGKKKVEETTAAETTAEETTAVVEETVPVDATAADGTVVTEETTVTVETETTVAAETSTDEETVADAAEGDTSIIEETTPVVEETAAETEVVETAEAQIEDTLIEETTAAEDTEETETVVETAEETEEEETEETLPEKIADAVQHAVETVEEVVLGRITALADENEVIYEAATPSEIEETEQAEVVEKPSDEIATSSEISKEYDDFAKERIEEAKEAVLEDKESAMENIKVAKIAQYTLDELGKNHYEAEIDGYSVDVFAPQGAFEDNKVKLEVKKLYKPEEEKSGDTLSEEQIAELKANDIYDNSQSLDIRFVDGHGKEVEPTESVKVRITVNDEDLLKNIDASSLEVHHIKEEDSTLKTEKVASTEDVKALDENDEKISDEDLKADAEGEEKEVNVASAVAEFEVESFSVYTITWDVYGYVHYSIRVHYVDQGGRNILDNLDGADLNLENGEIKLSEKVGGVTNYEYVEARLGSYDGKKIDTVKKYEDDDNIYVGYYLDGKLVNDPQDDKFVLAQTSNGGLTDFGAVIYYKWYGEYYVLGNHRYDYLDWYYISGNKYKEYDGSRYSLVTDNDIYLIYKKKPVNPSVSPQQVELDAPTTNKVLTDNGDGTYTLTLSVTGKAEQSVTQSKANVLVILDTSGSMLYKCGSFVESDEDDANYGIYYGHYIELYYHGGHWYRSRTDKGGEIGYIYQNQYTGKRYIKVDAESSNKTRVQVAKEAIETLAGTLLDDPKLKNCINMAFLEFNTNAKDVEGPTTSKTTFMGYVPANASSKTGTNWEAALAKARDYTFNNNGNPTYVVFLSDGAPTYRLSENGTGTLGNGQNDNGGYNFDAAQKVAKVIEGSNRTLYAINAFGDAKEMENLISYRENYFEATDHEDLQLAFAKISNAIKNEVAYSNVSIVDGISSLTATMDVLGTTDNYTYEIIKKNDDGTETKIEDKDILDDVKTAKLENGKVVWNVNNGNRLEDKTTYKVSFTVWPKQEAYDRLADADNGKYTDAEMEAMDFVKSGDNKWVYKTNTRAYVSYQTVNAATVNGQESQTLSDVKESEIKSSPTIDLTDSKLSFQKKWILDDDSQKKYITSDAIQLNLQRDGDNYYDKNLVINGSKKTEAVEDGKKVVTWNSDIQSYIAPGLLVPQAKGDVHGFTETTNSPLVNQEGTNNYYYMLDKGHDYKFVEPVGKDGFELKETVYHPMVVDGKLKDIEFVDANHKTFRILNNSSNLTMLTAINELKLDTLTVSKTYTGNMAVAQETTFDLHLYKEDKTTPASYEANYIEELNYDATTKTGLVMTKQSDGVYRFTIKPDEINKAKSVTITLPAGVSYKVSEVKNGTAYADYETESTWKEDNSSKSSGADTDVLELSKVNSVEFVNSKTGITPTGIVDNAIPFIALALAGIGAMAFLAYDFQKRRVFED